MGKQLDIDFDADRCRFCGRPVTHAYDAEGDLIDVERCPDPHGTVVLEKVAGELYVVPAPPVPTGRTKVVRYSTHATQCQRSALAERGHLGGRPRHDKDDPKALRHAERDRAVAADITAGMTARRVVERHSISWDAYERIKRQLMEHGKQS